MVCWAVVGIAVEDGSSSWSMDMLGHSGGTLYKCRVLLFECYEAVQYEESFSERGYRRTLHRGKTKNSCLTATHLRRMRTSLSTSDCSIGRGFMGTNCEGVD